MAGRQHSVGHAVLVTDNVLAANAFFGLVDEFLTPAMAELGYHRIGGFRNAEPRSRGVLTTFGAPSSEDGAPFLLYDFGFEAGSDDAQRLVESESSVVPLCGTASEVVIYPSSPSEPSRSFATQNSLPSGSARTNHV